MTKEEVMLDINRRILGSRRFRENASALGEGKGLCIPGRHYAYNKFDVVGEDRFRGCHYEWHIEKPSRISVGYHIESEKLYRELGFSRYDLFGRHVSDELIRDGFDYSDVCFFNGNPAHLGNHCYNVHLCSKQQHFWWVGFDVCDLSEYELYKEDIVLISDYLARAVEKSKWLLK